MVKFLVTLFAAAVASASAADSGPIAAVAGGRIRGALLEKGGAVFKGIPFAQPPVGELRWREPVPVKPWAGVRDARAFGAACTQKPNPFAPGAGESSSEDCLFLNIWTPEWPPQAKHAVMVWIPGGGNTSGTASQLLYDGVHLAGHGVVVVTVNYRLGLLGFFAHPELTRESPHHASGNQGLLDQIAALRWVRDNIGKFGGDPGNVTIFGESAGSVDVSVLMASPLSRGFFQRAIAESGAVVGLGRPSALRPAEDRGLDVASKLVTRPGASLEDLRAVPRARIVEAQPVADLSELRSLEVIVDGYVFLEAPALVFAKGKEHPVSLLMGSNARERIPNSRPPADLPKTIEEAYGPLAARGLTLYGVQGSQPFEVDRGYGSAAEQWATDTTFRCSAVLQATWHAAAGFPVFEYEFARVPVGNESVGATHASELAYVFGTIDHVGLIGAPPQRVTPVDREVSDAMQRYWTNFAKTGDPNDNKLTPWPKFEASARAYIQFSDAGPIAKKGLRREFCDLFTENVKREILK